MAITLQSGKKLGDYKEVKNEKMEIEKDDARLEEKEDKKENHKFTP